MTIYAKGESGARLGPWAVPIVSALIAAGASVIGSAYVGGQHNGAIQAIVEEHAVRIDRMEGEAKAAQKAAADASQTVAEKLGGLTSQVADLAKGVDRLERRLDDDGSSARRMAAHP